jgi:hypothetical protein
VGIDPQGVSIVGIAFVENREVGSFNAKQDNQTVAGIARMGDAFTVTPANGIAIDPESFATLDAAKQYVADSLGETIPARKQGSRKSGLDRMREKVDSLPLDPAPVASTEDTSAPVASTEGSRKQGSRKQDRSKVSAPKVKAVPAHPAEGLSEEVLAEKMRNVGFANRVHKANGRFDVYIDDPTTLKAVTKRFRTIPAHVYGKGSVAPAGTGNVYPTPEQADKLAKAVPGTDIAAQCSARGWRNWRIALREVA